MIYVDVYNNIGKPDPFMQMFGMEDQSFSAATIKKIFENNKGENEVAFNIHCDGGTVSEGLAIYDILRASGKTIHCNVDGGCHSMAICLLLSAPKENRTANPNSRALIHRVYAYPYDAINADEAQQLSNDMRREETTILDIYTERTAPSIEESSEEKKERRNKLKSLMDEENELTAKELKKYGFISKINTYNTNFKREMANKQEKKRKPAGLLNNKEATNKGRPSKTNKKTVGERVDELLNLITGSIKRVNSALEAEIANFDYTDTEGNVIFSIDSSEDSIAPGTVVSFPDDVAGEAGDYELSDGRIVTIGTDADGNFVVESIEDPNATEETENLEQENERLRSELENLKKDFEKVSQALNEMKNLVGTNYVPSGRTSNPKTKNWGTSKTATTSKTNENRTVEDIKAEARERAKLNLKKGGNE